MSEHSPDTFLESEAKAQRIAADLERLSDAITSYEETATSLHEAADSLSLLVKEQENAAKALERLSGELSQAGFEDIRTGLREANAALANQSLAIAGLESHLRDTAANLDSLKVSAADASKSQSTIKGLLFAVLGVSAIGFAIVVFLLSRR